MSEEFLCFQVGDERYVHMVSSIREIISYQSPVPVPGAPPLVEGILHVRGDVITVISGRELLEQSSGVPQAHWRIVIVDLKNYSFGLSVDSVEQMLLLETKYIQPTADDANAVIRGTANIEDDLLIVMDLRNAYSYLSDCISR